MRRLATCSGQRASSAAAICGRRQIGKSALLYEASRRYRDGHPVALLDLEKVNEAANVLHRLVGRLGDRIAFPAYTALRDAMKPVQPTLTARDIEVRDHSVLELVADGLAQRHANAAQLGIQFIDDIRRFRGARPLLMLDHFDRTTPAVRNWLSEDFLPDLGRVADTLLLLAAERAPVHDSPPSAWLDHVHELEILELGPFTVDDVAEWMAALNLAENRDLADFAAVSFDGMPGQIGAKLAFWAERARGGGR